MEADGKNSSPPAAATPEDASARRTDNETTVSSTPAPPRPAKTPTAAIVFYTALGVFCSFFSLGAEGLSHVQAAL
jgi:hypothetical protein